MIIFLKKLPRAHLWVAVAALALYLPACWWGAPRATAAERVQSWGVDDATPLGPLAEVHGLFVPSPERNLGYPILHPLMVAAAYSPYMGYLWITGQFTRPSGVFPFGLRDPVRALASLSLIAHLVSVFFGVGVAVAAYDAGLVLWDHRTGLLSAAFAGTAFPMFYYSRTGNVDVPVLFFTAAALAVFARCLMETFILSRAIWLGLLAGCALAVKETSAASFLGFPVLLLWIQHRDLREPAAWLTWKFWKAPLACGVSLLFAYGMGASFFLDPQRYLEHIQFARGRMAAAAGGEIAFAQTFPWTWHGNLEFVRAVAARTTDAMTLAGVLLAVAGLFWIVRREPVKALFIVPAVTYFLVLFCSARVVQLRYVMPVVLSLAFLAARAVTAALESRNRWLAGAFILTASFSLGLCLLRGADLTYAMLRDSRYAAGSWLAARSVPGDHVEYFGATQKLPPLARGVVTSRAIEYLGAFRKPRTGADAVAEIIAGWKERTPKYIVSMPDHSSPLGYLDSATCPPSILDALRDGSLGYSEVAQFETADLFPWVRRPALDYPTVNPPIRVYARAQRGAGE